MDRGLLRFNFRRDGRKTLSNSGLYSFVIDPRIRIRRIINGGSNLHFLMVHV